MVERESLRGAAQPVLKRGGIWGTVRWLAQQSLVLVHQLELAQAVL
ncbi:MAG: hypothetical protein IT389_03340 [Nitrospira sp.]|nr:hypothetical protein [Nitrospira sp.]